MGASTTATMPIDGNDPRIIKKAYPRFGMGFDYLPAVNWDVAAGDWGGSSAMAAIGGGANVGYLIWAGGAEDDALDTLWRIPPELDKTKPIYMQVLFTGSGTASKSCTWTPTYNALATGDDADIAPATALDETIPAKAAADVDVLAETYIGKIDGYSLDADEDLMMIRVTISGGDSVTDWGFVGLKINYSKI